MIDTSSFRYKLATEAELNRLFVAHGIQQQMANWTVSSETYVPQHPMHEVFCCKIWTIEYEDPTTNLPIATIDRQVHVGGKISLQIRRLRVGLDVYCLKLPKP
jgi:hypothetical protein